MRLGQWTMERREATRDYRLGNLFSVETMEDILSAYFMNKEEAYLNVSEASCLKIFSNFHRYLGQKGSLFPLVTIIEFK